MIEYKYSLSYILIFTKKLDSLLSYEILNKQIDSRRLKIFSNKLWKNINKTDVDFFLLIENLSLQSKQSKKSFMIEVDEMKFLGNLLNKFNLNPDFDYHEKLLNDLLNFIKNDTYIIIDEKIYPKTLYSIFDTIAYHNNLISDFIDIKSNNLKGLKDKGTAFSPNRNPNEVIIPIQNDINTVKTILENNLEVNGISTILNSFKDNPYEIIANLETINTDTFKYLKDDEDKKYLDVVLKIKKVLNASQGLIEEDFIHSMKFAILSFVPYKIGDINYGFKSKEKLRDFLNEVLEFVAKINFITYDVRDFNQKIQVKDKYKDNPIYEKITKTNLKKDPIYNNPIFIKENKLIIEKSLKIRNNKF